MLYKTLNESQNKHHRNEKIWDVFKASQSEQEPFLSRSVRLLSRRGEKGQPEQRRGAKIYMMMCSELA